MRRIIKDFQEIIDGLIKEKKERFLIGLGFGITIGGWIVLTIKGF